MAAAGCPQQPVPLEQGQGQEQQAAGSPLRVLRVLREPQEQEQRAAAAVPLPEPQPEAAEQQPSAGQAAEAAVVRQGRSAHPAA